MTNHHGMLWLHLDTASRSTLLSGCKPRFPVVFCDHVTLRFGVTLEKEFESLIGETFTIQAYEECWNDSVQAIRVKTPSLPDQYGVPHITISAANGVEPFSSVEMLKAQPRSKYVLLELSGTVRFVV